MPMVSSQGRNRAGKRPDEQPDPQKAVVARVIGLIE
jgi:hypothetical protein